MAGFVQLVEFTSSRIGEVLALTQEYQDRRLAEGGPAPVVRATYTADRDQPDRYLSVVEFRSYDAAMVNSQSPATSEFAARLAELCDAPPTFRNLDVVRTWSPTVPAQAEPTVISL